MTNMSNMDSAADEPLNDIENKLAALLRGEMTHEEFLGAFLESELYILVDGEPQGDVLGPRRPMVIASGPDAPRMFAVFSAPTRATRMIQQFSEYSYPILVNCVWVLEHLGPNMGVAFNPGCANGFELAPDGAQQLKMAVLEARAQSPE